MVQKKSKRRHFRNSPLSHVGRKSGFESHLNSTAEAKIYGVNMCHALFKKRPTDVIRVSLLKSKIPEFTALLKWCAEKRRAYHVVTEDDLERLTESVHHEGVCILAREPAPLTFSGLVSDLKTRAQPCCLVVLDGVQNPHNIGNILRLAAHFGVRAVLADPTLPETLPPSARRVSEGGIEVTPYIRLPHTTKSLMTLREIGFQIVSTSSHAAVDLFKADLHSRCVFVLGAETAGVSNAVAKISDMNVIIPGTGAVESLNVASACAAVVTEFYRRCST